MAEKPPEFIVTDRRKFTIEGERREGVPEEPRTDEPKAVESRASESPATAPARSDSSNVVSMPRRDTPEPEPATSTPTAASQEVAEEPPPLTAKESAEQHVAYQQSSQRLDDMLKQANPGMEASGPVTFEHVVQSIYLSAMIAMGAGTEPGQKPRIDILGARQSVDMLGVLQEKTKGNLTEHEQRLLQSALFELRMMFLEITNAIAQSAQQPPPPPGRGRG